MNFEPRNVFITGGAGFIGANFVRHWLANARGRARGGVRCADLCRQHRKSCGPRPGSALCLRARRYLRRGHGAQRCSSSIEIDTMVHFAAESHVDRSILGPDDFIRTNVVGTHALLKAAKALWMDQKTCPAHRFHHVSTDEVYGSLGPNDAPFQRGHARMRPTRLTRRARRHRIIWCGPITRPMDLQTTVTNCSNNYGPYQFPEKLIPLTIVNILLGKPLPVYGDGLQVRDWLHVEDHCAAIALALTTRQSRARCTTSAATARRPISRSCARCARMVDEQLTKNPAVSAAFPAGPGISWKACDLG